MQVYLRAFLIAALIAAGGLLGAQNARVDNVQKMIGALENKDRSITEDTTLINLYFSLNSLYSMGDSQELANIASRKAMDLCRETVKRLGPKDKKLKDWLLFQESRGLGDIGNYFSATGDYPAAVENHLRALKIAESRSDSASMSRHLCNLAIAYSDLEDHKKALEHYNRALQIAISLGQEDTEALLYGNIGTEYYYMGDHDRAFVFAQKALSMYQKQKDTVGIGIILGNIGLHYKDIAEDKLEAGEPYDQIPEFYAAAVNYKKVLELCKITGDISNETIILGSLGNLYRLMRKYKDAEPLLLRSMELSRELNDPVGIMESSQNLSELYEAIAADKSTSSDQRYNYSLKAMSHLKDYQQARDSIFNIDKSKDVTRKELSYEYEKREAVLAAVAAAERRNQNIITAATVGGLLLALIFIVFIFRSLRTARKQNNLIEEQKMIVEEHRKGIIDSITYAKRIQDALLKEEIANVPEHFILFKPKDIVSGDFYWSREKQGYWYICVADCTGHGVPGAFMSMLGVAFLNEINGTKELLSPAQIMNSLRDKIVTELRQSGQAGESMDGMDLSLLRYDLRSGKAIWAGANNALWISKQDSSEMITIQPDKQPIGYTINPSPFTDHEVSIAPGDQLYLFSDGFADQFGGDKGKKYKSKNFQQTLLEIRELSSSAQKDRLNDKFESWRGALEQIDDVTVVGIKFNQTPTY
jgi:serine phosphatase RsbU (regulator of sigma subunit)